MPKRPFYEIVLEKIEARVPLASRAQRADEIREFGEILELSDLLGHEREAASRLRELAKRLPAKGDAAFTGMYLENVAAELIGKQEKQRAA